MSKRLLYVAVVAGVALVAASLAAARSSAFGGPQSDPAGVIDLPAGYTYSILAEACEDDVHSTESGQTFKMPEDFDANVAVNAPRGETWLLSVHELTQVRPGEFPGDAGKCAVDEQTPGDADVNGTGSVSRLVLGKDGTTVLRRELITTGLHDLCAGALTHRKTFLVNEEFPYSNANPDGDPNNLSGWVWEIDPATGAETRLTGMGRFSHEQEAFVGGAWYLTDDRGDARFLYKFVPDRANDLTTGKLYGLDFDGATNTGTWIGPLTDMADPDAEMRSLGYVPFFVKSEGMVPAHTGNAVVFSESGASRTPGNIWMLTELDKQIVHGHVLVAGDFGTMSHPDNIRFNDRGDLFIFEDNGSDLTRDPPIPGVGTNNQIFVLPKGEEGADNLVEFGVVPGGGEGTGPWFSHDNKIMYLSIQDQEREGSTGGSRVLAITAPKSFNKPFDR
jgi:Alkaline phosphatase PhoX